ncbi:MAG: hypothetical protein ACO2PO_23580 [Candidatus Calescibacterium sp.]
MTNLRDIPFHNRQANENVVIPLGKSIYFFKSFDIGTDKLIFTFYGEDNQPVMMIADFTLSGGAFVYSDDRIKLTSRALLTYRNISGTPGVLYYILEDGKITFRSTSSSDNSTITALIIF